ncbi:MAG: hypothetical protein EZS28_032996, partial [Streblomastix strix]
TAGQRTGLQSSSGAQNPGLNTGLKLKETGSIQASNREKTEHQINEGYEDNAEVEEVEQTNEAALIQNKDYRGNVISKPQIQEILGIQPQNNQDLNALSQMDKDNTGPAPVGAQEKPKKKKGSRKTKIESLNVSNESSQRSNAQTQTQTTSTVPKSKIAPKKKAGKKPIQVTPNQKSLTTTQKRSRVPDRAGILQSREDQR